MRILVLSDLPPHVLGGAERQVALMVEQWVRAGHSVTVAGHRISAGSQLVGDVRVETRRLEVIKHLGRPVRGATYFFSLARLAYTLRKDVDVAYCRGMGDGLLTLVLLKALRVISWPIVACPINVAGKGDAAFIRSVPGSLLWTRLIDRYCDAINLIASGLVSDLASLRIRRPRLSTIPNGVVVNAAPERPHVASIRRLCWTGRMTGQKGLDVLLPALSELRNQGHKFTLELIGDGPELPSLKRTADELGLLPHITFRAPLESNAVRDRLLDSDVFLLPSRYEGMSNSALEAMETGLPILCTKCGGIDEYVARGAGWVCKADSLPELTRTLAEMFASSDAELLERGRKARRIVESEFSLVSIAAANLALMESVVHAKLEAYADSRPV